MKTQRIAARGMGGFLNPPGHPEHTHCVEYDFRRGEYHSACSLSAAAHACDINLDIRQAASVLLRDWKPGTPDAEWIRQCIGYFRGCYRNPAAGDRQWYADAMIMDPKRNPMDHADEHAGVHHIRKFYPGFVPTAEDFKSAHWGT